MTVPPIRRLREVRRSTSPSSWRRPGAGAGLYLDRWGPTRSNPSRGTSPIVPSESLDNRSGCVSGFYIWCGELLRGHGPGRAVTRHRPDRKTGQGGRRPPPERLRGGRRPERQRVHCARSNQACPAKPTRCASAEGSGKPRLCTVCSPASRRRSSSGCRAGSAAGDQGSSTTCPPACLKRRLGHEPESSSLCRGKGALQLPSCAIRRRETSSWSLDQQP